MPGHTCYHCKQWIDEGDAHDCWTTTEAALTAELSDDLREAWERLREAAAELGDQRIYASHSSIMFSRKSCYFFVRPKRAFLEVVIFLPRTVQAPQVHKVIDTSRVKRAHVVRIRHRDEVEAPITDWIAEAYALEDRTVLKGTAKDGTRTNRSGDVNGKRGTKARRKTKSATSTTKVAATAGRRTSATARRRR